MPNRVLREGILTSERVNRLGPQAEVFYRRLMSVVDDFGRYSAHPSLLRAALYPLRLDALTDGEMELWLAEVAQAGLVRVYMVHGKRYVQMCDFRQQLRAKSSKHPEPPEQHAPPEKKSATEQKTTPGEKPPSKQHAQHMPGTCLASAHLGGGGGGSGDGVEGGSGSGSGSGGGKSETRTAPPPLMQMAIELREQGVNITSAHPALHDWVTRGLSLAQAREAVAIARQRKPKGTIAANYLAAIVQDVLDPPKRRASAPAWWASEAATLKQGQALGLPPRPGEAMGEYRSRLGAALQGSVPGARPAGP